MVSAPPRLPILRTPGAFPVLWLGSLAAIYACVPETDRLVVVGGVLGGFVLVEVADGRPFPLTGQLVIAGVLVWAAWGGAVGRTRAEIGGMFAALYPAALVVAASVLPAAVRPPERVRWAVGAIGVVIALVVARTGALEPGAAPVRRSIAIWGTIGLAATFGVVLFAAIVRRRRGATPGA